MGVSVPCLTTFVDMTINILHKTTSSGTEPTKADMEDPLAVVAESKACMVNLIKDTACLHIHPMINSIQHLRRMRELLANNTRRLVGKVLLLEDWAIMDVLDPRSHRRILSNLALVVSVVMAMVVMYLDDLRRGSRDRIQVSELTVASKVETKTLFVAMATRPKYLEVQVRHPGSLEEDRARL